jgi:hypothetical protein
METISARGAQLSSAIVRNPCFHTDRICAARYTYHLIQRVHFVRVDITSGIREVLFAYQTEPAACPGSFLPIRTDFQDF